MAETEFQKMTSIMAKLRAKIIKSNETSKYKSKLPTKQNVSKGW